MQIKELLKVIKSTAELLLESQGWDVAFYIKEEKEDYYVLAMKDILVEKAPASIKKGNNNLRWDIQPFKEIYETKAQISNRIENITKNEIAAYDKILLDELFFRIDNDSQFSMAYKHILNITYLGFVHIKDFFSIKNLELPNIQGTKEIYFLGENGDGKSLVLMGIYLSFNKRFIQYRTEKKYTGKVIDMIEGNKDMKLTGVDTNSLTYGGDLHFRNFFAYGVHRGRYSTDNAERYGFMSLFDNNLELNNPVSWLKQLYLLDLEKRLDEQNMVSERKNLPINFPLETIQTLFYELLEKNVTIEVKAEDIKFIEKGFTLTFDQLSEGYKNLIIWVSDLIFRLHQNQPDAEKLNELTGVVLIDEIELHLHPKWQRTLVSKLRKFFPNIQFIFTTHSPTIIQGASDEAIIYKVYRDNETGNTHVSEPYYKKDLDDLMLNSLVTSPLFGLDDARLTSKPVSPDTSDSYALSRINKRVEAQLANQKKNGKVFITDNEIDSLIDNILNEELSSNDKNK